MKRRLFISMPVILENYDELKENFEGVIKGKWTPSNNLHVTLLFLGEKFNKKEALRRLEGFTCKLSPINLTSFGTFHSSIFYASAYADMNEAYQELCERFEIKPKKFLLHVTLMRMKHINDSERFNHLLQTTYPKGKVKPTINLTQSTLTQKGAIHTLVKRVV